MGENDKMSLFVEKILMDNDEFDDPLFVDEINFQDSEHLKQRIYLEKRRTERANYKFSIILINLVSFFKKSKTKRKKYSLTPIIRKIISQFCFNIRETDVVSLIERNKIIILLPDTSYKQAEQVIKRISTQLMSHHKLKILGKSLLDSSNITILSYPSKTNGKVDKPSTKEKRRVSATGVSSIISKIMKAQGSNTWEINGELTHRCDFNGDPLIMNRVKCFEPNAIIKAIQRLRMAAKRILDILGSLFGIIITSPIMAVTALLIKITSRGPILFKQQRIGHKGKKFIIFKFRSMRQNASQETHKDYIAELVVEDEKATAKDRKIRKYKAQIDQRITAIGKFIRKTSIDELPQLLNVFRGDMSLVGPRPHPTYEVELYKKWYYRRLLVKPGMAGFSKLNVRCTPEDYSEAMRYDLRYIEHWSLRQDFKIIFKTITWLFSKNGAY